MANSLDPQKEMPQIIRVGQNISNPYKEPALPTFNSGEKIGPNKVEQLIGEGGSAVVYRVWHENLEVVRAVKVLKKFTNKESRERFFTEAKILADIHHPNIVEIYNIGQIDQNIPFLEMEYVDGFSVKDLVSRHSTLPVAVAVAIAYYVSYALRYTHVKDYTIYGKIYHGLIHRDIKPDNIIISKEGIVKLMDFGIARPSEVSLHTVGQKIMGTLIYLSPEQLSGKSLDLRSDIFSLGSVLYEMITGQRAFPQKVLSELLQKKTKGEYRPVTSYGVNVPDELIAIIDKSMALEPKDRYENCADFGQDLFAVFRNISDRAPQDIIVQFMCNPSRIANMKPVVLNEKNGDMKNISFLAIGSVITIAILILLLIKMLAG